MAKPALVNTARGNLRVVEGAAQQPLTAENVLQEVADLIATRLPAIPFDDPDRGVLAAIGCVRRVSA